MHLDLMCKSIVNIILFVVIIFNLICEKDPIHPHRSESTPPVTIYLLMIKQITFLPYVRNLKSSETQSQIKRIWACSVKLTHQQDWEL